VGVIFRKQEFILIIVDVGLTLAYSLCAVKPLCIETLEHNRIHVTLPCH